MRGTHALHEVGQSLRAFNAGARPQRLLLASTGTKAPAVSELLYVSALAAPLTVNTMPEATLRGLAASDRTIAAMPADGGDCETVLADFARSGVDVDALAARLQEAGAAAFVTSWNDLLDVIAGKRSAIGAAG